jgi:hypothetical protein
LILTQPWWVSVEPIRSHMPLAMKIRKFSGVVSGALFAISALSAGALVPASAAAPASGASMRLFQQAGGAERLA